MNLITISDARKMIFAHSHPWETESVKLQHAAGRILRADITAERDAPPFDRVMMDGFALRAGSRAYRVAGQVFAGQSSPALTAADEALEVMTGCVLPSGADAVAPIEVCRVEGERLLLSEAASAGQFIHRQGTDGKGGRVVLAAGTRLGPCELAIAATEGATSLQVNAPLRVCVISTGDEVVPMEQHPEPWQIRASHAIALRAMLTRHGDVHWTEAHVSDEASALRDALANALENTDVLLVCGGMSKGRRDLVPGMLRELGVNLLVHRVAQRPGRPMGFGVRESTLVFGLPGNPLAVLCCARRHVVPTLDRLRGATPHPPPMVPLGCELQAQSTFHTFHPVRFTERGAEPLNPSNSGSLHSLADSAGFVECPPGQETLPPGTLLPFYGW